MTSAIPPDLPRVLADGSRIALVLDNLLSNAFRYTDAGGSIRIEAEADPAGVRFLVRDTGRGIPREHLDKVFAPFFRAPGQDPTSGVGLGLAIVRETIRHHGGEVGVESEPGQGDHLLVHLAESRERGRRAEGGGGPAMTAWAAGILFVFCLGYLIYALIDPEKF